jgi:intracellular multiplication protein IcmC
MMQYTTHSIFQRCYAPLRALFLCAPLFLLSTPVFAQLGDMQVTSISAQEMLVNIAEQVPDLMRLVTALTYVMGFYFIFYGILKLKQYGESRTMMSHEHSLKGPLILLTIGAMLLYFPTTVQMGLSTFWSEPNPYGYLNDTDEWSQFLSVCYLIIQFIGTVAFIRGLLILSHLSGQGGQPGSFGRGMTHIIGGVLCINIYQFVQVIMSTLGLQISS